MTHRRPMLRFISRVLPNRRSAFLRRLSLSSVRSWWWVGFAFAYPLLWAPWSDSRPAAYAVHMGFALIALVGAFVSSWWAHRHIPLHNLARRNLRLLARPPVLVAVAFVVWIWVSALASPSPGIALTGSLTEFTNGAYEYLVLLAIFLVVYAQVRAEPRMAPRLAWAVAASGGVLALLALVEVLARHGVMLRHFPVQDLPMVSFPQKGHLAGMLALAGGTAMGLSATWLVLFIATGIGLTVNRAAPFALVPVAILMKPNRLRRIAVTGLAIVVGLGLGVLLAERPAMGVQKSPTSSSSLYLRSFLYRASVRGIAARPLLGWGGGTFELHWAKYLSLDELSGYVKARWGTGRVLNVISSPDGYPIMAIREPAGSNGEPARNRLITWSSWHSHNEFMEIGLQSGLVGLALYLTLLVFGLRGLARGNPLSLGLLAYFVFLQLWFVIPETRALLWVVWAGAVASSGPAREQRTPEPAPS